MSKFNEYLEMVREVPDDDDKKHEVVRQKIADEEGAILELTDVYKSELKIDVDKEYSKDELIDLYSKFEDLIDAHYGDDGDEEVPMIKGMNNSNVIKKIFANIFGKDKLKMVLGK